MVAGYYIFLVSINCWKYGYFCLLQSIGSKFSGLVLMEKPPFSLGRACKWIGIYDYWGPCFVYQIYSELGTRVEQKIKKITNWFNLNQTKWFDLVLLKHNSVLIYKTC